MPKVYIYIYIWDLFLIIRYMYFRVVRRYKTIPATVTQVLIQVSALNMRYTEAYRRSAEM